MSITHITSVSQLNSFLTNDNKLSVIDFHAQWCGPCHMIAPTFEALAKQYPGVNFLKCDVEAAPDVSSKYGVRAMPTFIFLKGSRQVDQVQGADRGGLENAVKRHAIAGTTAFSGKGQTLGGSSSSSSSSARALPTAPRSTPNDPTVLPSIAGLDPQMTVFLGLLAAYFAFWYMSS